MYTYTWTINGVTVSFTTDTELTGGSGTLAIDTSEGAGGGPDPITPGG